MVIRLTHVNVLFDKNLCRSVSVERWRKTAPGSVACGCQTHQTHAVSPIRHQADRAVQQAAHPVSAVSWAGWATKPTMESETWPTTGQKLSARRDFRNWYRPLYRTLLLSHFRCPSCRREKTRVHWELPLISSWWDHEVIVTSYQQSSISFQQISSYIKLGKVTDWLTH